MYVDGFLIPLPKKNLKAYKKMAKIGAKIWKKHGALDYKECVGDDMKNEWGKSFLLSADTKKNETVVFSYIVYKSRKHRDAVNKKVMSDPAMDPTNPKNKKWTMPFDMKRMAYGGFSVLVDG